MLTLTQSSLQFNLEMQQNRAKRLAKLLPDFQN